MVDPEAQMDFQLIFTIWEFGGVGGGAEIEDVICESIMIGMVTGLIPIGQIRAILPLIPQRVKTSKSLKHEVH